MAATPQPTWNPPPPATRWGPGRVIALVIGILVLIPALGLILAGGLLLWADGPGRNDDGYLYSASDNFSTTGYAITSGSIDLSTGANWLPVSSATGTAKIQVTGANGSDVFVGIARVADTTDYIGGVERSIITDLGSGSAPAIRTGAGAPATPPTEQDFWVSQASGTGTQTLTWKPAAGNWSLVVMNADGSAGVSVDARIGATVPALTGLAWGVLAVGLVMLVIGVLLIVLAVHRRRPPAVPYGAAPYGPGVQMPPGPPPSWTPPAPVDRTSAADARNEAPTTTQPPLTPPSG
jgi:hypothetical protein